MNFLEQLMQRFSQPHQHPHQPGNLLGFKEAMTLTDVPNHPNGLPSNQREQMQSLLGMFLRPFEGPMGRGMPSKPIERQIIEHIFRRTPRHLLQRLLTNDMDGAIQAQKMGDIIDNHNLQMDWLKQRGMADTDFKTTPELVRHYPTMGKVM